MRRETAERICALNARTYSRIAHAFSHTRTRTWDEFTPLLKSLKNEMSVLDIGCGNGRLLAAFPKDIQFEYTGVDVSTELIQEAEKKYIRLSKNYRDHSSVSFPRKRESSWIPDRVWNDNSQIVNPKFFSGDILSLQNISNIRGKRYDIVSAVAVLNHIPSREFQVQALSGMKTFLKPGGMLFLTNWNLLQIGVRKNAWRYAWERFRMPDSEWHSRYGFSKKELKFRDSITTWKSGQLSEPLYYYSFTLGELARLCGAAGFLVRDVYYSEKGRRAHWWDGRNTVVIAAKA